MEIRKDTSTGGTSMSGEKSTSQMKNVQDSFTRFLLKSGALTFGDFTLKSGRHSPYFINAGAFDDGPKIALLGEFYARTIVQAVQEGILPPDIDTIFGPSYKGIPLAVSIAIALAGAHDMQVGYTFDRKEVKDHGDGGILVGTQLRDGMRVLLVDDVVTAGTAVRQVIPKILSQARVEIVGMVLSVDRMEKTSQGQGSAVESIMNEFHFPVLSIVNVGQIFQVAGRMQQADGTPLLSEKIASAAKNYLKKYGA